MMLTEQTAVPNEALPVQAMRDHLRLGSGFADDGLQDGLIVAQLRAAIAVIEGRTGKALLARRFLWRVPGWTGRGRGRAQALPLAPVTALVSVTLIDAAGAPLVLDPLQYRLEPDLARPRLIGVGRDLPVPPEGGAVEVVFDAGFGLTWDAVPADLAQAVMLLAADFYEHRHDSGLRQSAVALPITVQALIERWRTVRVLGGGGA